MEYNHCQLLLNNQELNIILQECQCSNKTKQIKGNFDDCLGTVTVKRKCFSTEKNLTISTTATQAVVFKISIIISSGDLAAAITLSRFSRVAKSDVETRRAVASVTAIMSVEDNFVNIDVKNNKTISKTIFFLRSKST